MAKRETDERTIVLKDVRLSFPHLFEPQERENDDGTKRKNYNCVLMIPKDHKNINTILKMVKAAAKKAKEKAWGEDPSKWPNIPSHQQCFKDGDNPDHTDREEYAGHYFINLSAPLDRPPQIITNRKNSDNEWIEAEPGQKRSPYAGCWVNGIIEIWGQKKNREKNMPNRLNGSVQVIQFLRDGEPFAAQRPDANDLLSEDDVSDDGELDGGYGNDDDDGDDGLL